MGLKRLVYVSLDCIKVYSYETKIFLQKENIILMYWHHHVKNANCRLFITIKLFHQYLLNKRASVYYIEGINAKI